MIQPMLIAGLALLSTPGTFLLAQDFSGCNTTPHTVRFVGAEGRRMDPPLMAQRLA